MCRNKYHSHFFIPSVNLLRRSYNIPDVRMTVFTSAYRQYSKNFLAQIFIKLRTYQLHVLLKKIDRMQRCMNFIATLL